VTSREPDRPLLVGGERLRLEVESTRPGFGEKFHPFTVDEAITRLGQQVQNLRQSVRDLPDALLGSRLIFQTTLLPNYLAASYFPAQLFEEAGVVAVGSRSAEGVYVTPRMSKTVATKSVIVAGTRESVDRLERLMSGKGLGRSRANARDQLREISEFRFATIAEILGSEDREAEVWEAVMHPQGINLAGEFEPVDEQTFQKWVALVGQLGGSVATHYRRTEGGLTFVPVELDSARRRQAARFNPLRSLRPMPAMRPVTAPLMRAMAQRVVPPASVDPIGSEPFAVFDGGVDATGLLQDCVLADLTREQESPDFVRHGTAVTCAALYGLVSPGLQVRNPVAPVHHFRVLPGPNGNLDTYAYEVLDQIETVISSTPYRVVNLSLGPDITVEDAAEPNRWTATLDRLAYEQDVLFVVAVGNNGNEDHATGLNRVMVPADMANALSVGASTSATDTPWERAAYSAIGPGRAGNQVQPNGVQFGGADPPHRKFLALGADGTLYETAGTSFAAPIVTRSLVELGHHLNRHWQNAATLRTFAVHFSEPHPDVNAAIEIGYGRLAADYMGILECRQNEIHLLYQDRLDRGEVMAVALPLPSSVVAGNVRIRMSLSFLAPTEPSQPLEYTRATVEPVFRPHADRFRFTKEGGPPKVLDIRKNAREAQRLLAEGYALGSQPVTKRLPGSQGPEIELRDGGKWDTLRTFDFSMRASSLREPRLDLTYLARRGGRLESSAPPLDFALLVTLTASRASNLYQEVRAAFPVLTPVSTEIRAAVRT
jgi:hypothetical protein